MAAEVVTVRPVEVDSVFLSQTIVNLSDIVCTAVSHFPSTCDGQPSPLVHQTVDSSADGVERSPEQAGRSGSSSGAQQRLLTAAHPATGGRRRASASPEQTTSSAPLRGTAPTSGATVSAALLRELEAAVPTPTASHRMEQPSAMGPVMVVAPVDARHLLVSYAQSTPAAAATPVTTARRLSAEAAMQPPGRGVVLTRLHLDQDRRNTGCHGPTTTTGSEAHRLEGLPFTCFTGYARDYTRPNVAYNARVAAAVWDGYIASSAALVTTVVSAPTSLSGSSPSQDAQNAEQSVSMSSSTANAEELASSMPAEKGGEDAAHPQSANGAMRSPSPQVSPQRAWREKHGAKPLHMDPHPPPSASWDEAFAGETTHRQEWSHRFLVSDSEHHAIWAIRVTPQEPPYVCVVPPNEFFQEVSHPNVISRGEGIAQGSGRGPASGGHKHSASVSRSAEAAEQPPTPLLGGSRGFVDGHFSTARFASPTALCWRIDEDAAAASSRLHHPRETPGSSMGPDGSHCEVLFISDTGNHAIRYANFRSRLVRTIAGLSGAPGYRDGSCVSSALREATSMVWGSSGLIFADGPNGAIRLISGVGKVASKAKRAGAGGGAGDAASTLDTPGTTAVLAAESEMDGGGERHGLPHRALATSVPSEEEEEGYKTRQSDVSERDPLPSATHGQPRVWTIAGAPGRQAPVSSDITTPDDGETTYRLYTDAASPLRSRLGFPADIALVPDSGSGAQLLFVDQVHHAIRTLDAAGVRTLVSPLDYYDRASGKLSLPPGMCSPSQVIPCDVVTEQSPLLLTDGGGQREVVSPQPYLHSARLLLLVCSPVTASVSMVLPVSASSMQRLTSPPYVHAPDPAAAVEGGASMEGQPTAAWEAVVADCLRIGFAAEGRRTLCEVGMPSVQQLVIPLATSTEDAEEDNPHEREASVQAAHDTAASRYLRLHFPWVLAPRLPQTESCIPEWCCYVSGRRRATRNALTSATHPGSDRLFAKRAAAPPETAVGTDRGTAEENSPPPAVHHPSHRPALLLPPAKSRSRSPLGVNRAAASYDAQFEALRPEKRQEIMQAITARILRDEEEAAERMAAAGNRVFVEVCGANAEPGETPTSEDRRNQDNSRRHTTPLTPRAMSAHRLMVKTRRRSSREQSTIEEAAAVTAPPDTTTGHPAAPPDTAAPSPTAAAASPKPPPTAAPPQPVAPMRDPSTNGRRPTAEAYDDAVEKLFAVYHFFAKRHTECHARPLAGPQAAAHHGAPTGDARTRSIPLSTLSIETQYSLPLLALWRFLCHCGYLDLPVTMAVTSLSSGTSSAVDAAPTPTLSVSEDGTWLPLSLGDGRSVVEVLHRCGLHTKGYHVLSSMAFKHFRRLIRFLRAWERHIEAYLQERTTPEASLSAPRRGRMVDAKIDPGGGTAFSLLDSLPAVDSLTEEEVIAAYRDAYQRAVKRVPGLREYIRSLRCGKGGGGAAASPKRLLRATPPPSCPNGASLSQFPPAVEDQGRPAGGDHTGPVAEATASAPDGTPEEPADRHGALSTPRSSLDISPIASPSRDSNHGEWTVADAVSTVTHRRRHESPYTGTDVAVDNVLALLAKNETALRQLFECYSVGTRVWRSAAYVPPQAVAASEGVTGSSRAALERSIETKYGVQSGTPSALSTSRCPVARHESSPVQRGARPSATPIGDADRRKRLGGRKPHTRVVHTDNQDYAWKIRQLYADSARLITALRHTTSEVVPVVNFARLQALCRTIDVYPGLMSQSLLQRAFVDAVRRPLLPPSCPHPPQDASVHSRERPISTGVFDSVLRDHAGLTFTTFAEAWLRLALTAFSLFPEDDVAYPTAVTKLNALMVWANRQVTLGLVKGRENSRGLRDATFGFPQKFTLFKVDEAMIPRRAGHGR